jgi:lipoprotein-anchoring transpeptidase ErfK/SrfK
VRRRLVVLTAVGAVLMLGLSGCTGAPKADRGKDGSASPGPSTPAVSPVSLAFAPTPGASSVRMDEPVIVKASHGELQDVTVVSATGKTLSGKVDPLQKIWKSTGKLLAGTAYTVTAKVTAGGRNVTQTASFTTLKPKSTMGVTIQPGDGWTVGVGMPVIVDFGKAVKNRAAAEKALSVTSTPKVTGAWRWLSSTQVQWRPKTFWPSGTKIVVKAAISSVELSPGIWGRRTVTSTYSVGSAMISTVDMNKHTMTVRKNGTVIRVLPVTTGKAGFLTRNGTKVIMSREAKVNMDAATTGTDPKDPNYYNLDVQWAMRLTWSGEFLHAAPWSVASQGKANVSHGCTGMSDANAKWLYGVSKVGDVVVYTGGTRKLEWGNGYTAWEKTFSQWSSGA